MSVLYYEVDTSIEDQKKSQQSYFYTAIIIMQLSDKPRPTTMTIISSARPCLIFQTTVTVYTLREAAAVPTAAIPTTAIPTNIDQPHTYGFQSSRLKFTLKSVTQPP